MAKAYLDWSLDIECPYCGHDIDLNNEQFNLEGEISTKIFSNEWDALEGREIECPKCSKIIIIESVEY